MELSHWIGIAILALIVIGGVAGYFMIPSFRLWVKTKGKEVAMNIIRTYVLDQARAIVEQEYKKIAARVVSGELTSTTAIKAELYRLGGMLKDRVKDRFGAELPALGEKADDVLDDLIRYAADNVSPFPGKDTAAALLETHVSDALVNRGVDWVRANYFTMEKPEEEELSSSSTADGAGI